MWKKMIEYSVDSLSDDEDEQTIGSLVFKFSPDGTFLFSEMRDSKGESCWAMSWNGRDQIFNLAVMLEEITKDLFLALEDKKQHDHSDLPLLKRLEN